MFEAVANIFRIPELRKRLGITLFLLLVYRLGWNVPLPGIDPELLKGAGDAGTDNPLVNFLNLISGGALQQAALFSLGIMPYISASIIFSLLVKVWPTLEKLSKEGSAGQRKINQWTRYATVPICLLQGAFTIRQFTGRVPVNLNGQTTQAYLTFSGTEPGFFLVVMWVLALTCGTIFLMWVGEQITEHGVGNGISLLIMAGIVARLPQSLLASNLTPAKSFLLGTMFVLVTLGVVFMTKGQRKIPVQYAKITRGRRVMGGQRHYMPIRVNMAGVMPVIFASALLAFPPLLFEWMGLEAVSHALGYGKFLWSMLYIVLTFFFAFFWVALMFNPVEMSKNMKEYGSFIPGIRPGRPTAEYLEKIMNRITLAGATFLALVAVLPVVLPDTLGLPDILTIYLGGTTILIVVSVALDLVDKLNSYLVMRNYRGFLGGAEDKGRGS